MTANSHGKPFVPIRGSLLPLAVDNIDTDQIVPGRFLTTTERAGMARHLFHDWRLDASGRPRDDCPLNLPRYCAATVIVAGANFGCGSSREHAAWALVDAGFRAIVALSFADIFRANALRNGLLPIVVEPDVHDRILAFVHRRPDRCVGIGLTPPQMVLPDGKIVPFSVEPFALHCLIEGIDTLAFLERQEGAIAAFECGQHPKVDTLPCSIANPGAF